MKLPGIFIADAKLTINFFNFTLGQEKLQGHDSARGIHALIKILLQEVRDED